MPIPDFESLKMQTGGQLAPSSWNALVEAVRASFVGSFVGGEVSHAGLTTQLRVDIPEAPPHLEPFEVYWSVSAESAGSRCFRVYPGTVNLLVPGGGAATQISPTHNAVALDHVDGFTVCTGLDASSTYNVWLVWGPITDGSGTIELVKDGAANPTPPSGGWLKKIAHFDTDSGGDADPATLVLDHVGSVTHLDGTGSLNIFSTLQTTGSSDIVADTPTDTLTLAVAAAAGNDLTITFDAGTDTATWTPPITPTYTTVTTTGGGQTAVYDGGGVTYNDAGDMTVVIDNAGAGDITVTIGGSTAMTEDYSSTISGTPEYTAGFTIDEGATGITFEEDSILSLWPQWILSGLGFTTSTAYAEVLDFANSGAGTVGLTVDSVAVPTISSTDTLSNKTIEDSGSTIDGGTY